MNTTLLNKALSFIRTTLATLSPVQHASHKDLQAAWQPIPVHSNEALRQEQRRRQAQHRRSYR